MNGAELLAKTAVAAGIEVCFLNPGTTEMTLIAGLDAVPEIRTILGLFEGVCSGAADGYGRMAGKPAMTLFHQGPGLANAIANFHNAQRARTPVLNVIGEQFTWHRALDPSLYLDINALAATVSGWSRTIDSANTFSEEVARAVFEARKGQIASLIVPHDYQLVECAGVINDVPPFTPLRVDREAVDRAADMLIKYRPAVLMLGGDALGEAGLGAVARIRAATGCEVFTEAFPARWERGAGFVIAEKVSHRADEENKVCRYQAVLLAGMKEPLTFVGRLHCNSRILLDDQKVFQLVPPGSDVVDALDRLADRVCSSGASIMPSGSVAELKRPELPEGQLTTAKACQVLAALQPERAIIVEEGITSAPPYYSFSQKTAPHTLLTTVGGNIGWGMPCAVGAAVACPDRPVINLQGDGSAMYTVQALWTQARESLNITTLVFSNKVYRALRLARKEAGWNGLASASVIELTRPPIGWVELARSLGVPGVSVTTAEALTRELIISFSEPGPRLIEMALD
jgi:acetolactate synthase-1/2/3 large subunit